MLTGVEMYRVEQIGKYAYVNTSYVLCAQSL